MTIALDAMGGDFAPAAIIEGVQLYVTAGGTAAIILTGNADAIDAELTNAGLTTKQVSVVAATQVIEMHEHPTRALKEKRDSSISVGFGLLAADKVDAFISAGNTGAMLVGSLYSLKPIEGILRPTISTIIPTQNGGTALLLDVGLNTDCKPEHLNQFAVMGSVYAQQILGIENPKVVLLNIGEEEGKGNLLAQAAYSILKGNSQIRFGGNAEGRDILTGGKGDVFVCDGFTGNIILKLAESLFPIKQQQQLFSPYFDRFNFENYGGTPVLGIAKPVVIGHGISTAPAFANAIRLAEKMIATGTLQKMQSALSS